MKSNFAELTLPAVLHHFCPIYSAVLSAKWQFRVDQLSPINLDREFTFWILVRRKPFGVYLSKLKKGLLNFSGSSICRGKYLIHLKEAPFSHPFHSQMINLSLKLQTSQVQGALFPFFLEGGEETVHFG